MVVLVDDGVDFGKAVQVGFDVDVDVVEEVGVDVDVEFGADFACPLARHGC